MVILGVSTTGPPGRSTARAYRQLPPRCRSGGSFVDGQGVARIAVAHCPLWSLSLLGDVT